MDSRSAPLIEARQVSSAGGVDSGNLGSVRGAQRTLRRSAGGSLQTRSHQLWWCPHIPYVRLCFLDRSGKALSLMGIGGSTSSYQR
eukprot:scaffold2022_cov261-Pinguiococcus_pyrenoidosus.AAC.8